MNVPDWLTESIHAHSVLWFFISSVIGGAIGASTKFLFEVLLPRSLRDRQRSLQIKRRFETPILFAAGELCARLANLIRYIKLVEEEHWLPAKYSRDYYFMSTLFATARLFGWLRILRQRVVYLDFVSSRETRDFERFLRAIQLGFSQPRFIRETRQGDPSKSDDKWIFTYWVETIGDAVICRDARGERVIDFAEFCKRMRGADGELADALDAMVQLYSEMRHTELRFQRIVALQCILNLFVESIDKNHVRVRPMEYFSNELSEGERSFLQRYLPKRAARKFLALEGKDFGAVESAELSKIA